MGLLAGAVFRKRWLYVWGLAVAVADAVIWAPLPRVGFALICLGALLMVVQAPVSIYQARRARQSAPR